MIQFENIKADTSGLIRELSKYSDGVMNDIDKEANRIANKARKKLKETSPYREHKKKERGKSDKHYRDSWKKTANKHKTRFESGARIRVISASKPHLTHLLENGHRVVLPAGRRFRKTAKHEVSARRHIEPVQQEAENEFMNAVDKVLKEHGK